MPGYRRNDKGLRLVVLTDAEHNLLCVILRHGLEHGHIGEPSRQVLEVLEHAREAPTRRRSSSWLARWRPSPSPSPRLRPLRHPPPADPEMAALSTCVVAIAGLRSALRRPALAYLWDRFVEHPPQDSGA